MIEQFKRWEEIYEELKARQVGTKPDWEKAKWACMRIAELERERDEARRLCEKYARRALELADERDELIEENEQLREDCRELTRERDDAILELHKERGE